MSQKQPPSSEVPSLARSFILGIPLFFVLLVAAGLVYLVAGALGWRGQFQILVALCIGPFAGLALLGLIWLIFKPKINGL